MTNVSAFAAPPVSPGISQWKTTNDSPNHDPVAVPGTSVPSGKNHAFFIVDRHDPTRTSNRWMASLRMRTPHPDGCLTCSDLLRGQNSSVARSEEHTSELQSRENLVCRLLLEKK